MGEQYAWADVLVLPSVSDTFALVILEAMSAGVPVITTPNTGGPDVICDGEDGFIVPIRSPEMIAERLELLGKDRDLLACVSTAASRRAVDFAGDNYATNLVLRNSLSDNWRVTHQWPFWQHRRTRPSSTTQAKADRRRALSSRKARSPV